MKITRVGVDLAKNVFQLHGVDRSDKLIWKRKLSRMKWLKVLLKETDPSCEIGIEACAGAHHWARILMNKGYQVKIIAPQFVKLYVKSNKYDANVAAFATANKTARMAWAMMVNETDYDPALASR